MATSATASNGTNKTMYDQTTQKPKIRWQNLFHLKCPNCDTRLENRRKFYACPNPSPTNPLRNCFFIEKEKAASYLLDETHPAHRFLSPHERANLAEAIGQMGVVLKSN